MNFPYSLDKFNDLSAQEIIEASTCNSYQKALTSCQIELSSIVSRASYSSKKMVGFCWKVHISITAWEDVPGYGFVDGRITDFAAAALYYGYGSNISQFKLDYNIQDSKDILYRYKKKREDFFIDNRDQRSSFGSYMPHFSTVTLPIPTGVVLPNSNPFHVDNRAFVTVESLQDNITAKNIPNKRNPWSMSLNGAERTVGGYSGREGLLYYDGVSDYNPKVVIGDFFPSQDEWEQDDKRGELLSALVHLVIVG